MAETNGKNWNTIFVEMILALMIAGIVGLITMYGTTAKLEAKFDGLCEKVSNLSNWVKSHVEDRDIHRQHQ